MDDQRLIKLESNIKDAAKNLQTATLSLKSCYVEKNASSINVEINIPQTDFVELRKLVTNDAKVYSTKILPFSIMVIENIQKFFKNYGDFTLEEFKKYIKFLAKEAEKNVEICDYTVELHTALLADLKTRQDKAIIVLGQMRLESQELEKRKKELQQKYKEAAGWAIGLAFVPWVNVIASPIIGCIAHNASISATAIGEQNLIIAAAADCIQGPLIQSLKNFIVSISEISGFFNILATELKNLNNCYQINPEEAEEYEIEMHYTRAKRNSPKVVESCNLFIKSIPTVKAELDSIPDKYNHNYVQEWLSSKQKENKLLSDWGLELFKGNKKILKLLEA